MIERYGSALERTRRLLEQLARESESLQAQISALQERLFWLEARLTQPEPAGLDTKGVGARLDVLLSDLDEQIDSCARERELVVNRRTFAKRSSSAASKELEGLEEEREILFNLWVAGAQLREAEDLSRLRAAILEIVINLIGCEEVGLFERVAGRDRLALTSSLGLDATRSAELEIGVGFIGEQLARQRTFMSKTGPLRSEEAVAEGLTVCMPLVVKGRVIAALLMYELLPHKPELRSRDRELLELLRMFAGPALAQFRPVASEGLPESKTWTQA